jgi:prevent-host-death family protein
MCRICTPKKYPISEAQDNLPKIINQMEDGRCVELTQDGKPVAVLVSARDYERLSGRKLGPKPDLWEAIQKFRADHAHELEELDLSSVFENLRDKSPDGR